MANGECARQMKICTNNRYSHENIPSYKQVQMRSYTQNFPTHAAMLIGKLKTAQ